MELFLSYAKEDHEVAREIARQLRSQGLTVYDWQDPERRGPSVVVGMEEAIGTADGFVALVSPDYLTSPWCHRERMLALHVESDRQSVDNATQFVHVLKLRDIERGALGFLRTYDWRDATTPELRAASVSNLVQHLHPRPTTGTTHERPPLFRDRRYELESLQAGLGNPSGPHFWLVTAPPAFGKSWLLHRLTTEFVDRNTSWHTRLVDIKEQPLAVRHDIPMLLGRLFGLSRFDLSEAEAVRESTRRILESDRPHLFLLDSAELLERSAERTLRKCLSEVYEQVQRAGKSEVRLCVVVASRREDGWLGIFPQPRVSRMLLGEFKTDVVRAALADLAARMQHDIPAADLDPHAGRVVRFSEGIPALVVRCLQWVQYERWTDLDRLETRELFEQLAQPYIRAEVLSVDSLFPHGGDDLHGASMMLEQTLRALVPFRLITMSHLRYALDSDPDLRRVAADGNWDLEHLWLVLKHSDLLLGLLNEPWHEVYTPIRRLLFRHFYRTEQERIQARRLAHQFTSIWTEKQTGVDQVRGMVECLWHEAALLELEAPAAMAERLPESALTLRDALQPAEDAGELRSFAAALVMRDVEIAEATRQSPGLVERIAGIIAPGPGR